MIILRQSEFAKKKRSYQDGRFGQVRPKTLKKLESLSDEELEAIIAGGQSPEEIQAAHRILNARRTDNKKGYTDIGLKTKELEIIRKSYENNQTR